MKYYVTKFALKRGILIYDLDFSRANDGHLILYNPEEEGPELISFIEDVNAFRDYDDAVEAVQRVIQRKINKMNRQIIALENFDWHPREVG